MRTFTFIVTLLLSLAMGALPGPALAARVAVLLSADVAAYQDAVAGFEAASGHEITSRHDMEGDVGSGRDFVRERVAANDVDLIYAVGVWALQAAAAAAGELPVVYSMVLNPPAVLGDGGTRVFGASMNVDVAATFEALRALAPDVRRVVTFYQPATTGFIVDAAAAVAAEHDLTLDAIAVESERQTLQAIEELRSDEPLALWILPEPKTLGRRVVERLLLFSFRRKVPLIGLSDAHSELGTVLTLGFSSSHDIGTQAAGLVERALAPSDDDSAPPFTWAKAKLIINLRSARQLGIEVSDELLSRSDRLIE